jgi:tetratricopeptide (TPR) repeat protein
MDEAAILARFLERYRADLEGDGVRSLSAYQRMFSGFEELIAREFADLAGVPTSEPGATSSGAEPMRWIGRYRIVEEIARGGQGEVYLAEDRELNRRVALKVLHGAGAFTESGLLRFRREAEVTARLDHPGICPVYEAASADGIFYIAMRFVPGQSLAQRISAARAGDGPGSELPDRDAIATIVGLARQIALALDAAHEKGIIHRDVKPGNIMVTPAGEAVLVDFGFAREEDSDEKLTRSGDFFGTPAYMSPEQLEHRATRIDRRTDVWSLGVTLYEALTLQRPFDAPTREGLHRAILGATPADPRGLNPAIAKDLCVVLQAALEKDRDRRYRSAGALAADLDAVLAGRPIAARPIGAWTRIVRWSAREPAQAGLAVLALVAVPTIAVLVALRIQDLPRIEAQDRAEREARRDAHLLAAQATFEEQHPAGAIPEFRAAIDVDPDCVEAIIGLALAEFALGRSEDALRTLASHAAVLGDRRPVHWLRRLILQKLGREIPSDPLPPSRDPIDYFLEGQQSMVEAAAGRTSAYGEAKEAFLNAIFLSGAPRLPFHAFAIEAAARAGDAATVRLLDRALARFWPDSGVGHHWRGIALHEIGDSEGAIAAHREAVRCRPREAIDHFKLGNLLARRGDIDEALRWIRSSLDLDPRYVIARIRLGEVLREAKQFEEAIQEFESALGLDPENAYAWRVKGFLMLELGALEEAIESLVNATRLDRKDAEGLYTLGLAYQRAGQWDDAAKAYRRAIELQPDDQWAHCNLGLVLQQSGSLVEALTALNRAHELDPEDAMTLVNLSSVHLHLGQVEDAVETARQATIEDPELAEAHFNYGHALREQGRFTEALGAMHRGKQLAASRESWDYASDDWVQEMEGLVHKEEEMLAVAKGATPPGLGERIELADLAVWTRRYRMAAAWYASAIEEQPALLEPRNGVALRAARAVVQACGGNGVDALDEPSAFASLRPRALEWLRRELQHRRDRDAAAELRSAVAPWLADPLLAPVRDEPAASTLPPEEARAWHELWAEVRAAAQ